MKALNVVDDAIVQELTILGSAERIFDALTNPEELLKWWNAEGKFRVTHVESDLRTNHLTSKDGTPRREATSRE